MLSDNEVRIFVQAGAMEVRGVGKILTTVDELNALPVGSVVYDDYGDLMRKDGGHYWSGGTDGSEDHVALPVVVVEVPE